jgi:hypothetical protein
MITNPNELTKGEFDELNRINEFDIFTTDQIAMATLEVAKLVKKGETSDLSQEELDIIKSGTVELKGLTKYTINEMRDGRICKTDIFCQPKQVKWLDAIEKSETGDKIEKGIFLDTPLNRELGRVGVTFEKGKPVKKSEADAGKEEDKEDMEIKMTKAIRKAINKSEDGDEKDVIAEVKKAFPEAKEDEIKSCMKKAYKAMADDFMKKAEEDETEKSEEDEMKEDKE